MKDIQVQSVAAPTHGGLDKAINQWLGENTGAEVEDIKLASFKRVGFVALIIYHPTPPNHVKSPDQQEMIFKALSGARLTE